MLRHWCPEQQNTKPLVKWKDLLSGLWRGPDPLLTSGRGYACIFPQDADSPIWIPDRLIRHVAAPQAPVPPIASTTKKEGTSSTSTPSANTGSPADLETTDIRDPRWTGSGPTYQTDIRTPYIKVIVPPTPNTYWDWITGIKSEVGTVLSCRLPVDMCNAPESKRDR